MHKIVPIVILLFCFTNIHAQDMELTFSGIGESSYVDSVTATNLSTNESITLPGNETLILVGSTGITETPFLNEITVYPNPSNDRINLVFTQPITSQARIRITNLTGQVVSSTVKTLTAGTHSFTISFATSGIYLICVDGAILMSAKVVCVTPSTKTSIIHTGTSESPVRNQKVSQAANSLLYTPGDWIHYQGMSDNFTTIITDSILISKNIEFEFVDCTDSDSKTYKIIKQGERWWMAENFNVSSSRYCYDNDVNNCKNYGGLYQWGRALELCPNGWYLPSDNDWKDLEISLGMDSLGVNSWSSLRGVRQKIGQKLKSNDEWNPIGANISGMNFLPAGVRYFGEGCQGFGIRTEFWTSSNSTHTGYNIIKRAITGNSVGIYRDDAYEDHFFSVRCIKNSSPLPIVNTYGVKEVSSTYAVIEARVMDLGSPALTSRGFCFSEHSNPTINDDFTNNGVEIGRFIGKLDSLKDNTTYYVRAYVTNDVGTAYGKEIIITTMKDSGAFIDTRDSTEYRWKTIGLQQWMAENLAYLPSVTPPRNSSKITSYYYVYRYNGNSVTEAKASNNYQTYGVLYNWIAAKWSCPPGWRLPTTSDWSRLSYFLGETAGNKMKSTSGWVSGNGDNSSGFNAFPAGIMSQLETDFRWLRLKTVYWTQGVAPPSDHSGYSSELSGTSSDFLINLPSKKENGLSVRCIRKD